jgi:hypothetical protein
MFYIFKTFVSLLSGHAPYFAKYDTLTAVFVMFKPSGNITPCFWVKRSQLFERTFELLDSEDEGTMTFLA